MKKTAVILLSVFILLQSGILSLQYVVKLIHHKLIVEDKLEKGLLDAKLVSFTAFELSDAKWENDHEFFLGEEKYDVVKTTEHNHEIKYTCISDKIENTLIKSLEKSEKKSNLLEELIKKINLQQMTFNQLEFACFKPEITGQFAGFRSDYSFQFFRFITKPPIF